MRLSPVKCGRSRSLSPATMPNISSAMPDGAAMAVVLWDAAAGALVTAGAQDGATRVRRRSATYLSALL